MNEDITKMSLIDIIKEMTLLDQQIDLSLLRYEKLRLEVLKRHPQVKDNEEFKQKVKKIGSVNNG